MKTAKSAKAVFDKASEILGLDMNALCFEENDKLDLTEYTQAALVTTCLAMTKVVREKGIHPDVTAGLSLGEYCAIAEAKSDVRRRRDPHSSQERNPHAEYRTGRRGSYGGGTWHGSGGD
mgnify:CR=1 FL=1